MAQNWHTIADDMQMKRCIVVLSKSGRCLQDKELLILNAGKRCRFESFSAFETVFFMTKVQNKHAKGGLSMVKKLKAGSNCLRAVYWSSVGILSMMLISLQPVLAADKVGGWGYHLELVFHHYKRCVW